MDSYKRIKELILEGSLGFGKMQKQVKIAHKHLDTAVAKKAPATMKYYDARDKAGEIGKKLGAKRWAKKHGEALYPQGRNKTRGLP